MDELLRIREWGAYHEVALQPEDDGRLRLEVGMTYEMGRVLLTPEQARKLAACLLAWALAQSHEDDKAATG